MAHSDVETYSGVYTTAVFIMFNIIASFWQVSVLNLFSVIADVTLKDRCVSFVIKQRKLKVCETQMIHCRLKNSE